MVISYTINQTKKNEYKMRKVQYRTSLLITAEIQGTSRKRLYDGLGLRLLVKRR